MTIQINDTDAFQEKLKSVFYAMTSLKDSGIDDFEDTLLDVALDAFLAQFKPVQVSEVPLPPLSITGKTPVAYVARDKDSGRTLEDTLHGNSIGCRVRLNDSVDHYLRHLYEIIPLFPND